MVYYYKSHIKALLHLYPDIGLEQSKFAIVPRMCTRTAIFLCSYILHR